MHSFMELIVEVACYLVLIIALKSWRYQICRFFFREKKTRFLAKSCFFGSVVFRFFFRPVFFSLKNETQVFRFFFREIKTGFYCRL